MVDDDVYWAIHYVMYFAVKRQKILWNMRTSFLANCHNHQSISYWKRILVKNNTNLQKLFNKPSIELVPRDKTALHALMKMNQFCTFFHFFSLFLTSFDVHFRQILSKNLAWFCRHKPVILFVENKHFVSKSILLILNPQKWKSTTIIFR